MENKEIIENIKKELYILEHKKECEICGKEFIAKRTDSKYCSSKCCKKAYVNRNKDKIREYQKINMRRRRAIQKEINQKMRGWIEHGRK